MGTMALHSWGVCMTERKRGTIGDGLLGSTPIEVSGQQRSEKLALVVGNKAYGGKAELKNPINDAEAIAETLTRLGFFVILGRNLDRDGMIDSLRITSQHLQTPRRVAMFFYAGHGLQVDGRNYLIPVGVNIEDKTDLERAVHLDYVADIIENDANMSIIFLDSCRDNPFARNLIRSLEPNVIRSGRDALPSEGRVRGGFAPIFSQNSAFIAFASAPHKVALDGVGKHSPFSGALVQHIGTPDVSISDMMIDVTNAVLRETKGAQKPWVHSSLTARFFFAEGQPPLLPKPAADPRSAEAEFETALRNPSITGLSILKSKYPALEYQAEVVIDRIRRDAEARRKAEQAEFEGPLTAPTERERETRKSRRSARLKRLLNLPHSAEEKGGSHA